jgi:hypothetical protein
MTSTGNGMTAGVPDAIHTRIEELFGSISPRPPHSAIRQKNTPEKAKWPSPR